MFSKDVNQVTQYCWVKSKDGRLFKVTLIYKNDDPKKDRFHIYDGIRTKFAFREDLEKEFEELEPGTISEVLSDPNILANPWIFRPERSLTIM